MGHDISQSGHLLERDCGVLDPLKKAKELEAAGKIKKSLESTVCNAIREDYAGIEEMVLISSIPERTEAENGEKSSECGGTGIVTDFAVNRTGPCHKCSQSEAPASEDPDASWKVEGVAA